MDSKLAEMYKTEEALQTEAEALATLSMAEKLAAAEDLDVDGMSDEEAEALASEILGTSSSDEEAPEAAEEEQSEEEAPAEEEKTAGAEMQEKIAEADQLGRVMAHAFVQERSKIAASQAASKVMQAGGKVADHVKRNGKMYSAGAGYAAGAGTGVAVGRKTAKKKEAAATEQAEEQVSSLDQLAIARAEEILKENGIELEQETEKQSSIDESKAAQLAEKVDARARELLVEAGYEFEEPAAE